MRGSDLDTVLTSLIRTAIELCDAARGVIWLRRNEQLYLAACIGYPDEWVAFARTYTITPAADAVTTSGLAAFTGNVVNVEDVLSDPRFQALGAHKLGDYRAGLAVPLKRDGRVDGVISLSRPEARLFTDREIALVRTFAEHAVIAIENVRLFEDLQIRNREITEALEQQTATSAILRAIAASPTKIQPVLDAVTESAARLCDAYDAALFLERGGVLAVAAHDGPIPIDFADLPVRQDTVTGRAVLDRAPVHVEDLTVAGDDFAQGREHAQRLGFRSIVSTPLLRDEKAIGALMIRRQDVRPFSAKQIDLLKTFADQAVIAIENVRLFEEVQARTHDVTEALEQQTATAEILGVISHSLVNTQPVFDAIVESGLKLFSGAAISIALHEDGLVKAAAVAESDPGRAEAWRRRFPFPLTSKYMHGLAILNRRVVDVPDVRNAPAEFAIGAQNFLASGYRAVTIMPLLRGDEAIGALSVVRIAPGPLSAKQRAVLETFADQAVIAIENVRLFDEVQAKTRDLEEALTFQKATGDVLEVIGRSASTLQPVLDAIVDTAAELCRADMSVLRLLRDGALHYVAASRRNDPAIISHSQNHPILPTDRSSVAGRVSLEARTIHIADIAADPEYSYLSPVVGSQIHSILGVPLFQDTQVIGVFALLRKTVDPFTERQIALVQTFADQAVIALKNVRLFEEVQARTRELSRSLEDLRTAQDRLVQTEKLASLGQLTAGIAHEIKNPLNFVNNFSAVSGELIDELREALDGAALGAKLRAEVEELTEMLRDNLDKVVQHGKRADSIVKNMLLHSRAGAGEHRLVDINAIVEESLNLAYHGARAEKPGFNITLEKHFDPAAGEVDLFPQEITRVLLNLVSNGFYATAKRGAAADGAPYEPTLCASTKNLGDRVEICIRDNGAGIPPEVQEKMFDPFFTTKPAGEGTGLGLSLSHDIVVKQHAGTIDVDTRPGEFTEFRIVLPRRAATIAEAESGDTA